MPTWPAAPAPFDFPTVNAIQWQLNGIPGYEGGYDGFVTKFSSDGANLIYSTYLGGPDTRGGLGDYPYGIAVDGAGNAYVVGYTGSFDFPLAGTPLQSIRGQSVDAFVAKIDPEPVVVTPPPTPSPTPTPTGPQTMHVGDLDGSSASQGRFWNASVSITVHDEDENPVAGATVSGAWSAGSGGSSWCTTDNSGQCSVTRGGLAKKLSSVTYTVDYAADTLTYQAANNHDPDGDSDGTSITIAKP